MLSLDGHGRIVAISTRAGGNHAALKEPGYLLQLVEGGKLIPSTAAAFDKDRIILSYPGGKTATVRVTAKPDYFRFQLAAISGGVDAVIWGPINTDIRDTIGETIGVVRTTGVAIGIQCLNLKTTGGKLVNEEGAVFDRGTTAVATSFGSALQAFAIDRSRDRKLTVWGRWPEAPVAAIPDGGLTGSAVALFTCTPAAVLSVIKSITLGEGLPYDNRKWTTDGGRPYMITTFSESNIDTFLLYAKRMGMAGVYHEDPFETWGHFVLKTSLFPHGRAGFKACVDKAHAMGLRLGFHTLSNFITTNDAYVTPKPDPGLATAGVDTLAADIDADATEIQVQNPFYFRLQSDLNSVRIGDEIVRYTAVTGARLTGCIRGAFGTARGRHRAGERIARLIDHPYKVFFPGWDLQKQIAANIARFINETGADQMDFDGHEGTYATGMGDLSMNTFAEEVFRGADHPVVFGSSRSNHYFWHFNDYLNWGEPWYGGFRESQSDVRFANQPFYERNYLPNMLGWFLITSTTTPDDVDWMLARAAGYNAGYALVVRAEALSNPHMEEIVGRFRNWSEVGHKNLFSKEQREWLQDPGGDASLSVRDGQWRLERFRQVAVDYDAKILQPGQPTDSSWIFGNTEGGQVPRIVLTALGDIGAPAIEIDHGGLMQLPMALATGQSLVIADTNASLYDARGRFVRSASLLTSIPRLAVGSHVLTVDAQPTSTTEVKVRVTIRLSEGKEVLKGQSMTQATSSVTPTRLRCEYLTDPEGIDELQPRLAWTLNATDTTAYGQTQTAYQVLVSSGGSEVWNTGWVKENDLRPIVYAGKPLESDRTYVWKVRVKDENGTASAWSPDAHWSTGLLHRSEWTAKWIGTGETFDPKLQDCNVSDPWFRKTVELKTQPARAMMFVASVGYHELFVNGRKIGDGVLAPAVTDHLKRARYIAYDITAALHPGANVIALWLGASWSIFSTYATDDKPRAPIVIAQADVYDSPLPGALPVLRIQTDTSWKTHPSPNRLLGKWDFGQMGGEIWDATKDIPNWNQPGCDLYDWKTPIEYLPRLMLTAQMVEPNRLFAEIHPLSVEARPDGAYRIDMGVNFAGWTEIRLKGQPGGRVDMSFSERENEDMTFQIHSAFILDKTGEGVFRNRFNYSSGRWITIRGLREKPSLADIRGWSVHTAYASTASFFCSDSLQNWIFDKVRWNFENLSIGGYVVDCPQRERLGYGGDAHATSESGVFDYGLGAMYTKWLEDWRDVQGSRSMDPLNYGGPKDDGIMPHTAPTDQGGGGPPWGGICITLPWLMYQQEGDLRVLDRNLDMIKNWLAFLDTHTRNNLLEHFGGQWDFLGDWLWPHAGAEGMNNEKPQNICFDNCYRVFNLRTAARIARVVGRPDYARTWEAEADASSLAIQAKYYNAGDHSYSDSSMGNLAAALIAEIPPPDLRAAVMERLAHEILVVRKGHIHVGITAGALLFKLLRAEGRDDLIYSMTSQEDYPGWGYMKANGATTLWEAWEGPIPGHSLLHSSYLYPGAWYIDGAGGIRRDPAYPGFIRFIIRPPHLTATQMAWARATYDAPTGTIKTAWRRSGGRLHMEVTVPPGTVAKLCFPTTDPRSVVASSPWARYTGREDGCSVYELPAGRYSLSGNEL